MTDRTSLPGLANILLEESRILGITVKPASVTITMEAALTTDHPLFRPPRPTGAICSANAIWSFQNVRSVAWIMGPEPGTDANDEHGYGAIDEFQTDPLRYTLIGDFGRLEIVSSPPELRFTDHS